MAESDEMATVDLQIKADKGAWNHVVKGELRMQLQNGTWRMLSIGFDTKHGVGVIFIHHDAAELAADTHQALLSLGKVGEELFKAMAMRAATVGHL